MMKNKELEKNWSYTITDPNHPKCGKTLWSGRYCAVTGIVHYYSYIDGQIYFLITKRGSGAADFQGKWCMPCGFLERNESAEDGVAREIFEETGITIHHYPILHSVETDPQTCNNGNVTLRYICEMNNMDVPNYRNINGEANEVEDVRWISQYEVDDYAFCFNHDKLIKTSLKQIKEMYG